jgi:hypothetical protein
MTNPTPTHLPDTAAALHLLDFADDQARLLARRGPGFDAAIGVLVDAAAAHERLARYAYEEETGVSGYVPLAEIRAAVEAYEATLCAICTERPADDGGDWCRECAAVERQDQADFEREHSAWRLG